MVFSITTASSTVCASVVAFSVRASSVCRTSFTDAGKYSVRYLVIDAVTSSPTDAGIAPFSSPAFFVSPSAPLSTFVVPLDGSLVPLDSPSSLEAPCRAWSASRPSVPSTSSGWSSSSSSSSLRMNSSKKSS